MLRSLRGALLTLSLLFTFATPLVVTLAPASAVDIFNVCSKTAHSAAEKAYCADCKTDAGLATDYCKESANLDGTNPVIHIIKIVINVLSVIGGAAVIIALIANGLRMVLANGDSNAVASARSGIVYALIGVIIIVLAQAIVVFVLSRIK